MHGGVRRGFLALRDGRAQELTHVRPRSQMFSNLVASNVPAGAKAVTQGQFKLFQQALKATHSGRWSNHSQIRIPGEASYTDM